MNPFLCFALCAALLPAAVQGAQVQAPPVGEPTREVTEPLTPLNPPITHESWRASKAYLSPDARVYREAASRKLEELAREVEGVVAEAARQPHFATRPYFETRLRALREHLEYARSEFTKLPAEKSQPDYQAARNHFDHTLSQLEAAIDQCQNEVKDRT